MWLFVLVYKTPKKGKRKVLETRAAGVPEQGREGAMMIASWNCDEIARALSPQLNRFLYSTYQKPNICKYEYSTAMALTTMASILIRRPL